MEPEQTPDEDVFCTERLFNENVQRLARQFKIEKFCICYYSGCAQIFDIARKFLSIIDTAFIDLPIYRLLSELMQRSRIIGLKIQRAQPLIYTAYVYL